MTEPLKVHLGMNKPDRERNVARLFERVGLDAQLLRSYPRHLSGGQLQRVAIARALTLQPALIVCDEITSALDVSVRGQIMNLLLDLQEEYEISYLFITHDLALVETFAHETLVMQAGRVVECGTTAHLFAEPEQNYTSTLLAATPLLDRLIDSPIDGPRLVGHALADTNRVQDRRSLSGAVESVLP